MQSRISALVNQCVAGWSLPRVFHTDAEVYQAEIQAIWRTGWLFVGHSCEIPRAGDYFTLQVDTDSIVVVRAEGGAIHGLHNVCRHRGSLICDQASGRSARLVCPYHQWSYDLDGKLMSCRGMPDGFDKSAFSLRPVHTREVDGLIYVSLATDPVPFEPAESALAPMLGPQGLRRAKVAKAVDYLVKANWKLIWENNRECYHCNVNHPQYIKANFDHFNADDTSPAVGKRMESAAAKMEAKWSAAGMATHGQTGMTCFPDAERDIWFSANRTALVDGWVSESMDGRQVAPLMGEYREPDVGTLRIRTLPNFWNHSSCDHAVSTRLLPVDAEKTAVRVYWLVEKDAVEGRDYDLDRLMPFWQLTSDQDWVICERQQRGVNSTAYAPGPYSEYKEYNVDSFVRWYLRKLGAP